MMKNQVPTSEMLVQMIITDVLERWPQTATVFHNHAMACVGCAVAPFYTINDATIVYGLPPEQFAEELLEVIHQHIACQEINNERDL